MSSLLRDYLNQEVIWTPAQRNADGTTKKDGSGRTLYDADRTIRAHLIERFRLIRDKTGAEIVSSGEVRTEEVMLIDDKINGRLVIASTVLKGLEGDDEGRVVYLK